LELELARVGEARMHPFVVERIDGSRSVAHHQFLEGQDGNGKGWEGSRKISGMVEKG
jgi:hypothetical protein